ncbi:MAG: arylsulfatase [Bacteroidales bacterium]|nr:arylsulfatase [Bacteroidales bacterium]
MRSALLSIIILTSLFGCQQRDTKDTLPNIIYFIADDLGYGDLSCLGQEKFSTPNLDRLAAEGMLFTQHYSGSTVCAPSRSSLMTGQHTGHTPIRGNKSVSPEGQWPIEDNTFTLAELLKQKGYVTGGFGKWGLGGPGTEGDPVFQGFDVFFGYNCQGKAHNYCPRHLWDNLEKVILHENEGTREGIYAPSLIHEKALEFIETNKGKPFFLFYPNVIPHAELFAPEEYMERFRGKFLPEKEYQGYDEGPKFRDGPYGSQPESHAAFAAMVTLLDKQVGEIIDKIVELGLSENTLVIFTSDNGPHLEGGADPDYFNSNGIYTGYKRDLYEGGIRVPTIAWWPGKIAANSQTDHLSAFWDVYPTLAELTGQEIHDSVDGISFLPTMLGKEGQQEHEYLYWEFHEKNGRQAIRKGDWKLVRYDVFSPEKTTTELYNIAEDPSETKNVAEENQDITKELLHLMKGARTESPVFTFN